MGETGNIYKTPPALYRRRLIPDETVLLKNDVILRADDDVIITKWATLKPRSDFAAGISCYYIKRGFKVSRFFRADGSPLYYYCDIIDVIKDDNGYIFLDLLADIIVYEGGVVKVVDLCEIADALDTGVMSCDMAKRALRLTDELLTIIYDGKFDELTYALRACVQ